MGDGLGRYAMASVRVEMERLSHKDIRQQRRGIRHLFELDDPTALPAFIPFLEHDDEWFVDQCVEAIRRWHDGEDSNLLHRLSTHPTPRIRRLAIEIEDRHTDSSDVLDALRMDEDVEVMKRAWIRSFHRFSGEKFLDLAKEGLQSRSVMVRRSAVNVAGRRGVDVIVEAGLLDSSPTVVIESIRILSDNHPGLIESLHNGVSSVKAAAFERICESRDPTDEELTHLLSEIGPDSIEVAFESLRGGIRWASPPLDEIVFSLDSDSFVPRLIRRAPEVDVDPIRASLLSSSKGDIRTMRIIEDLIGRSFGPLTEEALQEIVGRRDDEPLAELAKSVLEESARHRGDST